MFFSSVSFFLNVIKKWRANDGCDKHEDNRQGTLNTYKLKTTKRLYKKKQTARIPIKPGIKKHVKKLASCFDLDVKAYYNVFCKYLPHMNPVVEKIYSTGLRLEIYLP